MILKSKTISKKALKEVTEILNKMGVIEYSIFKTSDNNVIVKNNIGTNHLGFLTASKGVVKFIIPEWSDIYKTN